MAMLNPPKVTETKSTVFHGEQAIIECFAMLADRNLLAAIHRAKEVTVSAWLLEAAPNSISGSRRLILNLPE